MNNAPHDPTPAVTPFGGTIPVATVFHSADSSYRLQSQRPTLPSTDLASFPPTERKTERSLRIFTTLYSWLGLLGPFVIRALALVFRRLLKTAIIPEPMALLAQYPVLFDVPFYRSQIATNSSLSDGELLLHYFTVGDAHNLCPNPLFDPAVYRRYNMQSHEAQANTLVHYLRGVWHGSGVTSYLFHSRWYLAQNPDVAATGLNPLAHYLKSGYWERRDPSPVMQLGNYWARTPQLPLFSDPARHYVSGGFRRYPQSDEMLNLLSDMPFPFDVAREFQHFATHAGIAYTSSERTSQAALIRERIAAAPAILTDTPVVSVIIPVFNQLKYTITAVQSILASACAVPYEILIIDDCSRDETASFFADLAPIRCITQDENQGFIAACNRGASEARGQYLLFLNNDVFVLPKWLDNLYATFRLQPMVGLVGSQFLYPDGFLQEAGGIVWADGQGWNYGRGAYPMFPQYSYAREVDYCSGASIMLPTALFRSLGMFPEAFKPAYYEDTDLAMSVRAAGYSVFYQPASKVVHFEGVSSGRDVGSGVKAYQVRNHRLFAEKWSDRLAHRAPYGNDPDRAATTHFRGRILFADATTPTPDQDAGSVVADNYMRLLLRLGYHVTFVPVDTFIATPKYTQRIERMGVFCPRRPYYDSMADFLTQTAGTYDLIVVNRFDRSQKVYAVLDALGDTTPRMFIPADLHYVRELRKSRLDNSMDALLQSFKTKYEEYTVMIHSDVICVHSEYERSEILETVPTLDVAVTPIMYEVPGRTTAYALRNDILFVGGFRHPPNADGIRYFLTEVWPLVVQRLPDVRLKIVGSNMTADIAALASERVDILGFVEHLEPILDTIRLTIAPLRYGAGVKGKVTMSMCNGIPVVGTTVAFEGMSLVDGLEMLCADDPQTFADHIVSAYTDEQLWYRLSDGAVSRAQREYSIEANMPLFQSIIDRVTTTRPAHRAHLTGTH